MYDRAYRPDHPRADITGHIFQHVVVAEEALGRQLQPGEIIHHRDFDKHNNGVDNLLFPLTRGEHQQLPMFQARFIIMKGLYDEFLGWWRIAKVEFELEKAKKRLQRLKNGTNNMQRGEE